MISVHDAPLRLSGGGTMRKQPSLATVVAFLALFISMTGTALAAVIITSNDQVAAHTIAGANAPAGDNETLISGSVGTSDLHGNAVTGAKVANDGLTGADINEATLRLSNVIANPTGGTLGVGGLTTGSATPYPLTNATFTQRAGEIVEFIHRSAPPWPSHPEMPMPCARSRSTSSS